MSSYSLIAGALLFAASFSQAVFAQQPPAELDVTIDESGTVVDAEASAPRIPPTPDTATAPPRADEENYLGVTTTPTPLSSDAAEATGRNRGLMVTSVTKGSPAEGGGLKPGDILLSYDDEPLSTFEQLKQQVVEDEPDSRVQIEYLRGESREAVEITLGRHPRPAPRRLRPVPERFPPPGPPVVVFPPPGRPIVDIGLPLGGSIYVGRGGFRSPWVDVDWGADVVYPAFGPGGRWETAEADDRRRLDAEAAPPGENGPPRRFRAAGSPQVIEPGLSNLPGPTREQAVRPIAQTGGERGRTEAVRVQVRPRVEDGRRIVGIELTRTAPDGGVRVFELDHTIEGDGSFEGGELLKIDALADELQSLSPTIRRKVEDRIREVRIPPAERTADE